MKITSIYGEKTRQKGLVCGKGVTQQSKKDECDINRIVARYNETGYFYDPLQNPATRQPMFGDFSSVPDFQTAQNTIIKGREAFESLPSRIRKAFDNDPAVFLGFCNDPDSFNEAVEMGVYSTNFAVELRKYLNIPAPVVDPDPVPDPEPDPGKSE